MGFDSTWPSSLAASPSLPEEQPSVHGKYRAEGTVGRDKTFGPFRSGVERLGTEQQTLDGRGTFVPLDTAPLIIADVIDPYWQRAPNGKAIHQNVLGQRRCEERSQLTSI
jgi:hypothetical protein